MNNPNKPEGLRNPLRYVLEYLRGQRSDQQQNHGHDAAKAPEVEAPADRTDNTCSCGGHLQEIDSSSLSVTARCDGCHECSLVLAIPETSDRVPILLRHFDRRRGDGPERRPLDDHTMAEQLVDDFFLDNWPSPAAATDFGIETTDQYAALKRAVFEGVREYELDRVRGDGQAITELVRLTAGERYSEVRFDTPHDRMYAVEADAVHEAKQLVQAEPSSEARDDPTRQANRSEGSEDTFGGCPHCGLSDGYLNVGPAHYFVCHEHRTWWRAGYNLFSTWRQQSVAEWHENGQLLAEYDEIEPVYPSRTNDPEPEIER